MYVLLGGDLFELQFCFILDKAPSDYRRLPRGLEDQDLIGNLVRQLAVCVKTSSAGCSCQTQAFRLS